MERSMMNRITKTFSNNTKVLIVYLTAGFPEAGMDEELVLAAIDAGADIIELGFPFSDPVADGPLIQEASKTALANGTTLASTIELAGRVRQQRDTPILLMGYTNPVYHMGYEAFAEALAGAGADGVIIPDLPMEAAGPLRGEMRQRDLALIPMAAPNTPPERLGSLIEAGDGFLYLVSMAGLTGDALKSGTPWKEVAAIARAEGRLPVCVGFGISSGKDAAQAAEHADGVIVGSAITARINDAGNLEEAKKAVSELVEELSKGVRESS
jgi:tryptophan synthase alpha chain